MLSPSLEDYLEEIYQLSLQNEEIRVRDIADRLNVSSPSVVKALRKLHKENYVRYRKYQGIELTAEGKKLGNLLVKRNAVLQEFLFVINSNCDTAQEAEAMEHYLSPPTISAIEKLVGFMKRNRDIMEEFIKFCENNDEKQEQKHWSEEINNVQE
jgi:DtxR family Mn-dependent transcriptional regulator